MTIIRNKSEFPSKIPWHPKKGSSLGFFLPKQLHQVLETPLASHFYGQIQDLIGWFARSKQEMKDISWRFSFFSSLRGSALSLFISFLFLLFHNLVPLEYSRYKLSHKPSQHMRRYFLITQSHKSFHFAPLTLTLQLTLLFHSCPWTFELLTIYSIGLKLNLVQSH